MDTRATNWLWLSVLLLALGFALRVYRLDAQDIWGDEAMSIVVSALPLDQTLTAESNPPAYFWALKVARSLWGSSEFGLRYLSVLCGVLTVALVGGIGRRVVNSKQWTVNPSTGSGRGSEEVFHSSQFTVYGLLNYALFVASLSPFLIYYAQEARMYATVQVGAAGSLWLFLTILQRQHRQQSISKMLWLGYAACSLLALFSHYYAFSILFAQAAVALPVLLRGQRWRLLRSWLIAWGTMALLFVPYFIVHRQAWGGQTSLRNEEWALGPLGEIVRRTMTAFSLGVTFSADSPNAGQVENTLFTLLILSLAILGTIALLKNHRRSGLLLTATVLIGLLFAWAITPLLPFFWERYLIPILPAYLVLIAAGLAQIARWNKLAAVPTALLVVGLSLYSINNYFFDAAHIKGGYGEAMAQIGAQAQSGDLLLLNGPLQAALFSYYQPTNLDSDFIPRDQLLDTASANAYFAAASADYERVWLVESGNPLEYDPNGVAKQWLAENGRFALHRDFVGVGVDMFVLGRLDAPTVETNFVFGDEIELVGFGVESAEITPSDPILLTLFWQADQPISNAYTVFTHLVDATGNIIAQTDRQPVGGSRPTNTWQPNETIIDSYAILLPPDTPPSTYTLQVGLYLWPNLTRLTLPDGTDKATLAEIAVSR